MRALQPFNALGTRCRSTFGSSSTRLFSVHFPRGRFSSPSPFTGYAAGMDLPAGYQLRAPMPGDLEPVAAVLAADDLDDAGQVVLDAGFLGDQWSRVGFDLATDAWVVVDAAGTVVGYGQVLREEPDVSRIVGSGPPRPSRTRDRLLAPEPDRGACEPAVAPAGRPSGSATRSTPATAPRRRCSGPAACARSVTSGTCSIELTRSVRPGSVAGRDRHHQDALAGRPAGLPRRPRRGVRGPLGPPSRAVRPLGRGADTDVRATIRRLWLLARSDGQPVGALTATALGDRGWIGLLGVLAPVPGPRDRRRPCFVASFADFATRGVGGVCPGRRRREPDRGDRALRARGDARGQALGPVGALHRQPTGPDSAPPTPLRRRHDPFTLPPQGF